MLIYPAIDIKDGKCVRLYQGDMKQVTVFDNDPVAQAKIFEETGADFLHIVDLDGAVQGKPVNAETIKKIVKNTKIPIQVGGGIRTLETMSEWISIGVSRVILGTVAVNNPNLVKVACEKFSNKIAIGIDAKKGMVAIEGWQEVSDVSAIKLVKKFADYGVVAIIYTDIEKDGAMQGINFDEIKEFAENIDIPVIASGGVTSLEDIKKLKEIEDLGVSGVITGKAIYEKTIDLKEAINLVK